MEKLIYLSAFNTIAVFLIVNKWDVFELKKKLCVFCVFGWVSISEALICFVISQEVLESIRVVFFVWVCTIIFYFYVKNSFE